MKPARWKTKNRGKLSLFPTVGHHYLKDEKIDSYLPDFFPLASVTQVITVGDNASGGS